MKKFIQTIEAKALCTFGNMKKVLSNNKGMEVVQVLVIVIIAITLGALLLATLKTEFTAQLRTVSTKLSGLFS
ncbi:MAG: hypothetical protein RR576_00050 [Oscillospiraceae bacterium]